MLPLVFVVDDELNIAMSLAAILSRSGFEAVAYTNPQLALAQADLRSPRVLVTDVLMPQMSGVDLALSLGRTHPECKVILLSGLIAQPLDPKGLGLDEHRIKVLVKPVHPTDLIRFVKEFAA